LANSELIFLSSGFMNSLFNQNPYKHVGYWHQFLHGEICGGGSTKVNGGSSQSSLQHLWAHSPFFNPLLRIFFHLDQQMSLDKKKKIRLVNLQVKK